MTTLDAPPQRTSLPLSTPRLPGWAPALVGLLAICGSGLLALPTLRAATPTPEAMRIWTTTP
jgi:hypothetical protein